MAERCEGFLRKLSVGIALSSIGVGFLVMLGWFFDVGFLKSVFPGMVTMKFNTSLSFILTGISLLILLLEHLRKKFIWAVRLCCSVAALIGLLTFFEYILNIDFGIDQFFFREPEGAVFTVYLGRMAILTAIAFFLINIALLLSVKETKLKIYIAQVFALIAGLLSYQSLIGYVFGVKILLILHHDFTAMALHTALLFFLLAGGVLSVCSGYGFMRLFCSNTSAGIMMRRLFPVSIILPPLFGWVKFVSERAGLISNEIGISFVAISNSIVFLVFLWMSVRSVFQTDIKRQQAENKIKQSEEEWNKTFNSITDFIFILDNENHITKANRAFFDVIKAKPEDVIGRKCFEIMHKTNQPWPMCPHQKTLQDNKTHTEEVDDPNIGIPILVTISPIFNENGKLLGSVHIAKDISAIKNTEKELRKKMNELESFNSIAVGRELDMIQLKKRIKELEEQA
jgi:PAS domain S-box-containing protein